MSNLEIKKKYKKKKRNQHSPHSPILKKDSNFMYVIVFDRLSPGKSEDRLWLHPHFSWVTSCFFFILLSLLLSLLPENLERQHSTQNTADDTPEKCTQEKIFERYHSSCRLYSRKSCKAERTNNRAVDCNYVDVMPARDWALV